MNQFLNKMERKFGRYAVPDLIKYLMGVYMAGAVISLISMYINFDIYGEYLSLNYTYVLRGEIWRLFTYLLEPAVIGGDFGSMMMSVLFFMIKVSLFLMFGHYLENVWGAFRFNLYFFTGYLLNIIAALILYLSPLHVINYYAGFEYIYWSMFFAFALYEPDMPLLVWFVLPIKIKWLALFDGAYLAYLIVDNARDAYAAWKVGASLVYIGNMHISAIVAILVSLFTFFVFFLATRNYKRVSPGETKRKRSFKKKIKRTQNVYGGNIRHRCAICGRTEMDAPELDFRYCSKCEGNYEYCSDHLFTHEHVRK